MEKTGKWRCPLESTFFSLTPKEALIFRNSIFTQIHEIVFHGKGGYDWETIYNMPIWLRKFTWNAIANHYKEENQSSQESTVDESIANMRAAGAVAKKEVNVPSYVTKASKK
jgi:hypothetical protein